MARTLPLILVGMLASAAHATTFNAVQAPDPLRDGGVCNGVEIASFGSYIYQWPERVHLVFWPLTDPHTYWVCDSGLVFPVGPIPELDAPSKEALAAWLAKSGARREGENEGAWRVRVAEGVAATRGEDAGLVLKLARAQAFLIGDRDPDAPRKAREALLPRIEARLAEPGLSTEEQWELRAVRVLYLRDVGLGERAEPVEAELRADLGRPLQGDDAELEGFRDYLLNLLDEHVGRLPRTEADFPPKGN